MANWDNFIGRVNWGIYSNYGQIDLSLNPV